MNYKNIFKRETKVIAYVVICLTLLVLGTSYALFLQVNNNSNNQVVKAGSLVITYSGGNVITAEGDENNCLEPTSDAEAVKGACKFTLSIENTGTLPMQYDLLIYNNTSEVPSGGNLVDYNLIKHTLNKKYTVSTANTGTVTTATQLSKLNSYNDTEKKVLEHSVIPAGETIEFSLNIWIDENATADIIGQYVYLKLDVVGTVFEQETATQALLATMGDNGLAEIMSDTALANEGENNTLKEYRYTGSSPKNYIYYNCSDEANLSTCETWRILGIYNIENAGALENRIKIIKNNSDLNLTGDSVATYLNSTFYDSLNESAKSKLVETSYKLGGAEALNINSKGIYYAEQASIESASFKVGLMNVSDYSFASNINSQNTIDNIASEKTNNWLFKASNEWLINKNSNGEVYTISNEGAITTGNPAEEKLVRPVVYLANDVKIIGGDGTENNPYVLAK